MRRILKNINDPILRKELEAIWDRLNYVETKTVEPTTATLAPGEMAVYDGNLYVNDRQTIRQFNIQGGDGDYLKADGSVDLTGNLGVDAGVKIDGVDISAHAADANAHHAAVTPGGSDTQIQFNDGGIFGGDAYLIWDKTNHKLCISPTHSQDFGDCIHIENLIIDSANDYYGFVGIFKKTDGASDEDTYYIGGLFQMRISDSDKVHGPVWGLYVDAFLEFGTIGAVGTNRDLYGIEVNYGTVSGSTVNGNVFGIYIDGGPSGTVSGRKYDIWIENNPPKIGLINDTNEDIDGGRESFIDILGRQSGGEISVLARIRGQHDGTSDDQKGDLIFFTNDGSDDDTPTERMRIDSNGDITMENNLTIKQGINIVCNNNEVICHDNEVVFA